MPIEILIKKIKLISFALNSIQISRRLQLNIIISPKFNFNFNYLLSLFKIYFSFRTIIDLIGVDWPNKNLRFHLIYNFLNINYNIRSFFSIFINENTLTTEDNYSILSGSNIFKGLNWLERENWDMFGIMFFNHTDLRRILTDYGFEGFPLRKDFPLTGFIELRYDEEQRSIIYENVELSQEFRFFDFESPWKKI